jgi:hypothetical protein
MAVRIGDFSIPVKVSLRRYPRRELDVQMLDGELAGDQSQMPPSNLSRS